MSLKRALNWANAGWPVFPARANKTPWFADWQEAATTERLKIEQWWASVPDAEVGVVPGMAECFVLDVDVKKGKHGFDSLKELEEKYHFTAEDFPSQSSPSGGKHYFFKGYAPTSSDLLGSGLDTRGGLADGTSRGYILAYQDAPPVSSAECPSGVVFTFAKRDRSPDTRLPAVYEDLDANIERAKTYLRGVESVPEGSRGISLFKHAAVLKDLGVGFDKALELLAEYPAALGDPPQDSDEAYGRIASAYRNGQLQPGIAAINPETIKALAAEEKGLKKRLRLATWPEMRNRPEPGWIVRNLIPAKSLVGMYGPGGSYKSFIAVDIALAISMYRLDWGGQDILTQGPVVVISGEGSQGPRVRAWEKANAGAKVGDTFAVLDGIDLSDPDDIVGAAAEIDQAIEEKWGGKKPVLLVVDTLARASGSADENSNKDMGRVVAACDELRRHFDCTVLLVHHTPKSGHEWRGATAVYFALDAGISIKRTSDKRVALEVARMKDGAIGQRWAIQMAEIATGRDRQGEPETSLVVQRAKIVDEAPEEKLQSRQEVRAKMLAAARTESAREVLRHMVDGATVTANTLAKQVTAAMTALGSNGDFEGTRAFFNRAVVKTSEGRRLNTYHPLADCVVTLDPLAFGALKEKAPEDAIPEGLPD
jgi:hypothetical protein